MNINARSMASAVALGLAGLTSTAFAGPCSEDTNGDLVVSVPDLVNVILFWGTDGQGEGVDADVNDDGIVDVQDLSDVITAWGPCPPDVRACCVEEALCLDLLQDDCTLAGGTWMEAGSSCESTLCPDTPPLPTCLINSIGNDTTTIGAAYTGPTPSFVDPTCADGGFWSLVTGPSGMSIDGATGVVSWPSPTFGPHEIVIRATIPAGGDDESWWLAVNDVGCQGCTFALTCDGDANGDDCVNDLDIAIVEAALDTMVGDPGYNGCADFNCDGIVDGEDVLLLTLNLGLNCSGVPCRPPWPPDHMTAELTRSAVVPAPAPPPPTPAAALGEVTIGIQPFGGDFMAVRVAYRSLTGPAQQITLREGFPGHVGPVLVTICDGTCGTAVDGDEFAFLPLTPDLLMQLLTGGVYVEVTTTANPGGELRGQLGHETFTLASMLGTASPELVNWTHGLQEHVELLFERLDAPWRQGHEMAALMDGLQAVCLMYSGLLSGVPEQATVQPFMDSLLLAIGQGKESVEQNLRAYGADAAEVPFEDVDDATMLISVQQASALTGIPPELIEDLWALIPLDQRLSQLDSDASLSGLILDVAGIPIKPPAPSVPWWKKAWGAVKKFVKGGLRKIALPGKLLHLVLQYGYAIADSYAKYFPDWDKVDDNMIDKHELEENVVRRIINAILDP